MKRVAQHALNMLAAVVLGAYGLWSWFHGPRARLPFRPADVRHVLVIRLDLLGDAVFSIPTVEAIAAAFPAASVDCLALPYTAPVLRRIPCVTRVHDLDVNRYRRLVGLSQSGALLATVRSLRASDYDLALGLSGRMGGVFAVLSGARWRVGYASETYRGCYNLPVAGRRYERPQHEVEYCLDLVRSLRIAVAHTVPALRLSAAAASGYGSQQAAPREIGRRPAGWPTRPYAVLVPGASNGSAKRWPAAYWAEVGDQLAAARGVSIVVAGSAAELELARNVARRMRGVPIILAGETSVDDLCMLLAEADLVMGGDTGPLHLAAALGAPVVGIFGPTDPINTGPLGTRATTVRLGLACSPCYDLRTPADCKLPDRSIACMWGLRADRVYAAARQMLGDDKG